MRKNIIFLAFALILTFIGCQQEPIAVTGVYISNSSLTLTEGEAALITATVQPENATIKDITWKSSKPGVASVNDYGMITANFTGIAIITATSKDGNKTASCEVTVEAQAISVKSIKIDPDEMVLSVGEEGSLSVVITPNYATNQNIEWSSSNNKVVTVDNGKVCAIATGEAIITALSEDGGKKATCRVEVKDKVVEIDSVRLNKHDIELTEGDEFTLSATIYPADASDQTIKWKTTDDSVASVSNGNVKALKEGEATITAVCGNKRDTCHVKVNARHIPVESISLSETSIELLEGESTTLQYTILPEDASNQNIIWSSSNESVATVENGYVTTHKEGTVKITAQTEDGGKKATCRIMVKARPRITSLEITTSSFNAYIGSYYNISASVTPSDAKYDLEWTVSDDRVAAIYNYGLTSEINTKDYGTTDIIVKDKISGKSASITVSTIVENFTWQETSDETLYSYPVITIKIGEERQLRYTCTPSYATHIFSDLSQFAFYAPGSQVESQDIISIDANGVVTGLKEGTIGIKGTGRVSGNRDRLYIKVVSTYTESEYNDEFAYADIIPAGEKMKFKISGSSDIDIFKFTRPQNGFYFSIKLTYEGDDSNPGKEKHIKYTLYNANLEPYGNINITFDSSGGEDSNDTRYIDTSEGYIKFHIDDYWKNYPSTIPTGYFTVEFIEK